MQGWGWGALVAPAGGRGWDDTPGALVRGCCCWECWSPARGWGDVGGTGAWAAWQGPPGPHVGVWGPQGSSPWHGAPPDPTVTTRGPNGCPCHGTGDLKTPLSRRGDPMDLHQGTSRPHWRVRHPPPAVMGIPKGSCDPQTPPDGAIPTRQTPARCRPVLPGRVLGVAVPRARAAEEGETITARARPGRKGAFVRPSWPLAQRGAAAAPRGPRGHGGVTEPQPSPDALFPLPGAGGNSWKSALLWG